MAQQRVFVVMQRTDIPAGVLQMTELKPNDSQRNYIYEPPGQTQYVKNIPGFDTVATTGAGPITTNADYIGLAAYLIDNVEDASTTALTAAVANASATAIIAAAQTGAVLDSAALTVLMVGAGATAATAVDGGTSTGSVEEVLGVLMGRSYLLPGTSEVEDGANLFNTTVFGSFTNDGEFKQLYDTSAFKISNGDGQIAGFKRADFDYLGTSAPAVVVYAEDGTLL